MPSYSVEQIERLGGEWIEYFTENDPPKTIRAVIERQPTLRQFDSGLHLTKTLEAYIARDATDGIMVVHERQDQIDCRFHLSDVNVTRFRVTKILSEDAGIVPADGGMFHLEIQA